MPLRWDDIDDITAEIVRQFIIKDETATAKTVAGWASSTKSEADHRLEDVLKPEGIVQKVGTEPKTDPLNDAKVWGLTEHGVEWAVRNESDIYEELLENRPGELVVDLLQRTESVEQHMDSVRGEFESVKDDVEEIRDQDPDDDLVARVERVETEVSEVGAQVEDVEQMVRVLTEDVDSLQQQFERVVGDQY